jgi:hypothetical protein
MDQQPLTYQQLLAQQYEENAKDLLVYQQNDFENVEDSEIPQYNATINVGTELTNPEEFKKFGGDRGTENFITKPKEYEDKGTASVRRSQDVKTHIFNIDTLFRSYAVGGIAPTPSFLIGDPDLYNQLSFVGSTTSSSSHFVFNLDSQYKNIISAKLSSLQIPNKFFNLVDIRKNYYIYTKKGEYGDDFILPITRIDLHPRSPTLRVIKLGLNISPLIVGDTITIETTSELTPDYRGTYNVIESTISTVTIRIDFEIQGDLEAITYGNLVATLRVGVNSANNIAGYTRVAVDITSVNMNPLSTMIPIADETEGQTGFYYTNSSIFTALNNAYKNNFPDLQCSYLDGFCNLVNGSPTETYTINLTPEVDGITPSYFPNLGAMLGFFKYIYQIAPANATLPAPCNFSCAQVSPCSTYGSVISENKVDMNADSYIQLAIQNWENIYQQDGADSYYGVFQKVPINVPKGDMIYDVVYNNSIKKKFDFIQPVNIRYLEIYLYDRLGRPLLMPGVDWSMVLEVEEVLNSALYDKLRQL